MLNKSIANLINDSCVFDGQSEVFFMAQAPSMIPVWAALNCVHGRPCADQQSTPHRA